MSMLCFYFWNCPRIIGCLIQFRSVQTGAYNNGFELVIQIWWFLIFWIKFDVMELCLFCKHCSINLHSIIRYTWYISLHTQTYMIKLCYSVHCIIPWSYISSPFFFLIRLLTFINTWKTSCCEFLFILWT